jgi:hypothetical protein
MVVRKEAGRKKRGWLVEKRLFLPEESGWLVRKKDDW